MIVRLLTLGAVYFVTADARTVQSNDLLSTSLLLNRSSPCFLHPVRWHIRNILKMPRSPTPLTATSSKHRKQTTGSHWSNDRSSLENSTVEAEGRLAVVLTLPRPYAARSADLELREIIFGAMGRDRSNSYNLSIANIDS